MTKSFQTHLTETLQKSCRHFLKHGLSHLLEKHQTEDNLLQAVLNVQAAIECLTKLHQLNISGALFILKPEQHNLPEAELIEKLQTGRLRTTNYEQAKRHLIVQLYLDDSDSTLLKHLQDCRNSIAHLGVPALPPEIRENILKLTVRLVNKLAWSNLPAFGEQYFENHASLLLGDSLFADLLLEPTYIKEAIRLADNQCLDGVWRCPECRTKAWADMGLSDEDEMTCVACGYTVHDSMLSFTDCPCCFSERALFYDACNCVENNPVGASCTECQTKIDIIVCKLCDRVSQAIPAWVCECELEQ